VAGAGGQRGALDGSITFANNGPLKNRSLLDLCIGRTKMPLHAPRLPHKSLAEASSPQSVVSPGWLSSALFSRCIAAI